MADKSFLMALDFGKKEIKVAGEVFYVKELTAGDSVKYESSLYTIVNGQPVLKLENSKSRLIALALVDAEGKRIFDDKDIEQINSLPAKIVDQLFKECSRVNGIGEAKN